MIYKHNTLFLDSQNILIPTSPSEVAGIGIVRPLFLVLKSLGGYVNVYIIRQVWASPKKLLKYVHMTTNKKVDGIFYRPYESSF